MALDPFALDEKDRQSSRATIATFAPALSFDMTKTKRIACSGLSEDGKNLISHLNDRRCCRRKLQHQLNQIHSYGVKFTRTESFNMGSFTLMVITFFVVIGVDEVVVSC